MKDDIVQAADVFRRSEVFTVLRIDESCIFYLNSHGVVVYDFPAGGIDRYHYAKRSSWTALGYVMV